MSIKLRPDSDFIVLFLVTDPIQDTSVCQSSCLSRCLWAVVVLPTSPVFDDLDISDQWPGVLQDVL